MIFVQVGVRRGHSEDAFHEIGNTVDHPNATAIAEPMTTSVSNDAMMVFRALPPMVGSVMTTPEGGGLVPTRVVKSFRRSRRLAVRSRDAGHTTGADQAEAAQHDSMRMRFARSSEPVRLCPARSSHGRLSRQTT